MGAVYYLQVVSINYEKKQVIVRVVPTGAGGNEYSKGTKTFFLDAFHSWDIDFYTPVPLKNEISVDQICSKRWIAENAKKYISSTSFLYDGKEGEIDIFFQT